VPAAVIPTPPPARAPAVDTEALAQACQQAFDRKQYKELLDSCARAFAARPGAAPLAALVAEAELDRGRVASGLSWAQKAAAADPTLADAYAFIGSAEQQAGHAAAAKAAYQKYLELAPTGRFARDLKLIVAGR
jgi:tetratricopeptide (TPR) repeat protein